MKQLSQVAMQHAKIYLTMYGRAVDQARFAFYFEGDKANAVVRALEPYQNDDGGFGHGLEPDLRTAASSAVATQQGLNILREVGADSSAPMIQRAVAYLLAMLDKTMLRWEIVPSAVEDAPHAPWWTYGESAGSGDDFQSNPRAALIGFLCEHQALVPPALLSQLIETQLAHLVDQPTDQGIDMHALPCYVTLANSPNLSQDQRQQLESTLVQAVRGTVATDPADFAGYQLLPLDVAPTPDALLAATVDRKAVDAHLDYLIETQLPDGSWPVPWSWSFVDEAAWAQAERDWKGFIAVNQLRMLAAYGRIAVY